MKTAYIASLIVILGIVLCIAILLFINPMINDSSTNARATSKQQRHTDSELSFVNFQYLDSCNKYVLKDFLDQEIFENNTADIKADKIKNTITAGKKLKSFLIQLEEKKLEHDYVLILEGNLVNEWAPDFERDNTWAYRISYERALAIYKLWLQNDINLRDYKIEVVISGNGYYGLCPVTDKDSKRFSAQVIPRS